MEQVKDYVISGRLSLRKASKMEAEIFLKFLRHFNKHRLHLKEDECVLCLDGHKSHCSLDFLHFCRENRINLVCIPPHICERL